MDDTVINLSLIIYNNNANSEVLHQDKFIFFVELNQPAGSAWLQLAVRNLTRRGHAIHFTPVSCVVRRGCWSLI